MGHFFGGYDERPRDVGGNRCPDCAARIGSRATYCKVHAGIHSAQKKKVKKQIARLLDIHHAKQNAEAQIDAAIDAALGGFEREVRIAERSVRG